MVLKKTQLGFSHFPETFVGCLLKLPLLRISQYLTKNLTNFREELNKPRILSHVLVIGKTSYIRFTQMIFKIFKSHNLKICSMLYQIFDMMYLVKPYKKNGPPPNIMNWM